MLVFERHNVENTQRVAAKLEKVRAGSGIVAIGATDVRVQQVHSSSQYMRGRAAGRDRLLDVSQRQHAQS